MSYNLFVKCFFLTSEVPVNPLEMGSSFTNLTVKGVLLRIPGQCTNHKIFN